MRFLFLVLQNVAILSSVFGVPSCLEKSIVYENADKTCHWHKVTSNRQCELEILPKLIIQKHLQTEIVFTDASTTKMFRGVALDPMTIDIANRDNNATKAVLVNRTTSYDFQTKSFQILAKGVFFYSGDTCLIRSKPKSDQNRLRSCEANTKFINRIEDQRKVCPLMEIQSNAFCLFTQIASNQDTKLKFGLLNGGKLGQIKILSKSKSRSLNSLNRISLQNLNTSDEFYTLESTHECVTIRKQSICSMLIGNKNISARTTDYFGVFV